MLREHHRIQLKTDAQTAARTAREIAEQADREGRTLTAAEKATYDQHMTKGRELIAQLKADDKDRDVTAQARPWPPRSAALAPPPPPPRTDRP